MKLDRAALDRSYRLAGREVALSKNMVAEALRRARKSGS